VHDLTPLADLKVKRIVLPPRVTSGMDAVRKMATLTHINGQPAAEFWKKWDADQAKVK